MDSLGVPTVTLSYTLTVILEFIFNGRLFHFTAVVYST